ncbi:phosphopantetheine-binding protein [Fictibacillus sp. KIGAM418]|uniref:Phosphopantetheine-binding protein n=1 Tax=Fictibacillus marinisediminis TaxID=2878389 RepID=A0A9X1XH06_9BACL|nr:phosphopantetheine-binding protein [Fictibacillus marinisediminis]MCK6259488.1 phosphopantetheine-binding protein [Fictibacillus marinisediminis]
MSIDQFLDLVSEIVEKEELELDQSFEELGLDSTNVIELLIEFEMEYDVDILDDNLNLDDIHTLKDAYDYLSNLID